MKMLAQYLLNTTGQYNPFLTVVYSGFILVWTLFHTLYSASWMH